MWVAKCDLAATHHPLARRRQGYAKRAAILLDKCDKQVRKPKALLTDLIEVDVLPELERAHKSAHGEDWLRPAQQGADAVTRSKGAIEGKRTRMAPPPRERMQQLAVMLS